MRVLLFGERGWIGGMLRDLLQQRGHEVVVAPVRAEDTEAVCRAITEHGIEGIVSAIGRTHGPGVATIDWLEGRLHENLRDNLHAPLAIAEACRRCNIKCMQIATGCIFTSTASGQSFSEHDVPNFFGSSYSIVKGVTDQLLKNYKEHALFFRIRMPIVHELHPRSFLTKITKYERVCSMPNAMSVLDGPQGLLALFVQMFEAGYMGCYNGTNPGLMTHNEILARYQEVVDPFFTWANFTQEQQRQVLRADRSNNELNSQKLERAAEELNFTLPSLRDAIESVLTVISASESSTP